MVGPVVPPDRITVVGIVLYQERLELVQYFCYGSAEIMPDFIEPFTIGPFIDHFRIILPRGTGHNRVCQGVDVGRAGIVGKGLAAYVFHRLPALWPAG